MQQNLLDWGSAYRKVNSPVQVILQRVSWIQNFKINSETEEAKWYNQWKLKKREGPEKVILLGIR